MVLFLILFFHSYGSSFRIPSKLDEVHLLNIAICLIYVVYKSIKFGLNNNFSHFVSFSLKII